jgi:hypothetical protein
MIPSRKKKKKKKKWTKEGGWGKMLIMGAAGKCNAFIVIGTA